MDSKTVVIPEVSDSRKYWFFRTEGGEFYPDFKINNFIALGWDEFDNLDELRNSVSQEAVETLKSKFKEKYEDERRYGLAVNQMITFVNTMQIGDIVLIPSKNGRDIAIGEIASDAYIYMDSSTSFEFDEDIILDEDQGYTSCTYKKRRDIKWLKVIKKNKLDPQLYKLLLAHNTITDASNYDMYIDRRLHAIYYKKGKVNVALRVRQEKGIPTRTMSQLLSSTLGLIDAYEFNNKELEINDFEIKMMVESPGVIQFIGYSAAATVLLGGLAMFGFGADVNFEIAGQKFDIHTGGAMHYLEERNRHEEEMARIQAQKLKSSMEDLQIEIPKELK
ncbi:hypothetical protein [Veillonella caviae]|uniref:restriction endonuclease n=1 Tax=Veillonella caviae TaxID=248316 RepID=UPI002A915D74|nr:hypothetical protein [Veillonella caviae]MDY5254015.1 hypothetical protein [Veillonella caviae]